MPLYAYRCNDCAEVEAQLPMGQAADTIPCPGCGRPASRRFTAPHLSSSSGAAYQLIERTQRSATEPEVVTSPGAKAGAGRGGGTTMNPLHRKLPRPD